MQYAGFAIRAQAGFIDFVVLLPLTYLYWGLASLSWSLALWLTIPYVCSYAVYNVYCHGRWGQTLGKRWSRIKVVTLAGEPIGWRQALLRHAVDLLTAGLMSVAWVTALHAVSPEGFAAAGVAERPGLVKAARPAWERWVRAASVVWVLSELVVLLLNEQRRALHDYLAGTLVQVLPAKPAAGRR